MIDKQQLVVFDKQNIRRTFHHDEWFYSVIDVVGILAESANPRRYWSDLKRQLIEKETFSELYEKIVQLKMESPDGKMRETDCANTESLLRIIQSIPSPKAEPFKRWLAKVGYERIQEIENPELAQERMKQLYEQKGYPKEWIDKRLRGIAIRENLTDEWKARGITTQSNYAILTAEISKATFGMTPSEYKKIKIYRKKPKQIYAISRCFSIISLALITSSVFSDVNIAKIHNQSTEDMTALYNICEFQQTTDPICSETSTQVVVTKGQGVAVSYQGTADSFLNLIQVKTGEATQIYSAMQCISVGHQAILLNYDNLGIYCSNVYDQTKK